MLYKPSTKQSTKSSKSTSVPVPPVSSSPIATDGTSSSSISFDQQLQLIQLQKEKLELELKVLTISRQERPSENRLADLYTKEAAVETTDPRRNKRNIDWPQDFFPSIQGEYDKLELPEFLSGFLIMIKSYDPASKDAMLAHLELLTIKAISYIRGLAFALFTNL